MPNLSALPILALAAQLAGIDPGGLPPPPPTVAPSAPQEISRLSLAEVSNRQNGAYVAAQAGDAAVELAAAFDAKGMPWLKLRQGSFLKAYPLSQLDSGVDVFLPSGQIRLTHRKNDGFHLTPPGGPEGPAIPIARLNDAFYDAAVRMTFAPVQYAVLYEDGKAVPASVSLVRRDERKMYYVSYHDISKPGPIDWILAVDGIMYGMRLENEDLVFYSKPISDRS